jgi:phosphatidylglycerophosphate synthase
METSAILVYLLSKTRIKPTSITVVYGLAGLAGGVLLAIPSKVTILIAVTIFFTKSILDWADGHLARITGQTSVTGAIIDPYGAFLGALGLQMGLGFYVAHKSGIMTFYYLTALIPFFYAARTYTYAFALLFRKHITGERMREYLDIGSSVTSDFKGSDEITGKGHTRAIEFIRNFLDDRARTVDLVCLLILIEMFTPIFITWVIFLGFLLKQFVVFAASFYIVAKDDWAERQLAGKMRELASALERVKDTKDDVKGER